MARVCKQFIIRCDYDNMFTEHSAASIIILHSFNFSSLTRFYGRCNVVHWTLTVKECSNISQERAESISKDPSKGLPNWGWQTHGQVTATPLPAVSIAASSGFSISPPSFPSTAIFPPRSMNSIPQSLYFTSSNAPSSNALQNYYQVNPPQAPP